MSTSLVMLVRAMGVGLPSRASADAGGAGERLGTGAILDGGRADRADMT